MVQFLRGFALMAAMVWGTSVLGEEGLTAEGAVTADELRSMCKLERLEQGVHPFPRNAADLTILKSFTACTFYIAGVANLILLPTVSDRLRLCLPKEITMDGLRLKIENLVLNTPKEVLEDNATLAIIAMLRMDAVASHRVCYGGSQPK